MKHLSVTIPDSLYESFIDFFKHVPNVVITEDKDELVIPEWHKKIVLDRIKNEKESDLLDWDSVKNKFDGL